MIVESYVIGILSNATYDLLKKEFSKECGSFKEVYEESALEVSKTNKRNKLYLKKIFGHPAFRKIATSSLPREEKMELLISLAEGMKTKTQEIIEVDKLLEEFYSVFKQKIHSNPKLASILAERYSTLAIGIAEKNSEKMDAWGNKVLDTLNQIKLTQKKQFEEITNELRDNGKIEVIGDVNLPIHIVAKQRIVLDYPIEQIKKNIEGFYTWTKEKIEILGESPTSLFVEYYPVQKNNFLKIEHKGLPYKIIYPPFSNIRIYIKRLNSRETMITIFTSSTKKIRRIEQILYADINPSKIGEVNFKKQMKKIAKDFLSEITVIDYDPMIYKPVRTLENVQVEQKGKRTIMYGEKGFLRRPILTDLIENLKFYKKNQKTDIFFLKLDSTKKIIANKELTLQIGYDGKVGGFFPRKYFSLEEAEQVIIAFIQKYSKTIYDSKRIKI